MKILSRYISKEYTSNLLLGLLVFTFVMLLDHLFELIDLVLNKGIGVLLTLQMLFLLLPSTFSLTLPVSCLLAALLTFGHLSETSEVTAFRASGLGAWSYIQMPFITTIVIVLFLIPFNTFWAPHAHAHFRQIYVQVLERNPLIRIEEKTFVEIGEYHLYADKRNRKTHELYGVTIYKTPLGGAPLRIFANQGVASVDPKQGVALTLRNGRIDQIDPTDPSRWFSTDFGTYVLSIPFGNHAQASSRALEEMDSRELSGKIQELRRQHAPFPLLACEYQLRLALAVSPLLFVLLGIPLAVRVQRGGRSLGFGISLGIVVIYYVMVMGGVGVGQRGLLPAWLAVWLGNAVIAAIAIDLNRRFLH